MSPEFRSLRRVIALQSRVADFGLALMPDPDDVAGEPLSPEEQAESQLGRSLVHAAATEVVLRALDLSASLGRRPVDLEEAKGRMARGEMPAEDGMSQPNAVVLCAKEIKGQMLSRPDLNEAALAAADHVARWFPAPIPVLVLEDELSPC